MVAVKLRQEGEVLPSHPDDLGVQLVEAEDVARPAIAGESAGAETDDADAGRPGGAFVEDAAGGGGIAIVGGGRIRPVEQLRSMCNRAVCHGAAVIGFSDSEDAVEVALGGEGLFAAARGSKQWLGRGWRGRVR